MAAGNEDRETWRLPETDDGSWDRRQTRLQQEASSPDPYTMSVDAYREAVDDPEQFVESILGAADEGRVSEYQVIVDEQPSNSRRRGARSSSWSYDGERNVMRSRRWGRASVPGAEDTTFDRMAALYTDDPQAHRARRWRDWSRNVAFSGAAFTIAGIPALAFAPTISIVLSGAGAVQAFGGGGGYIFLDEYLDGREEAIEDALADTAEENVKEAAANGAALMRYQADDLAERIGDRAIVAPFTPGDDS